MYTNANTVVDSLSYRKLIAISVQWLKVAYKMAKIVAFVLLTRYRMFSH